MRKTASKGDEVETYAWVPIIKKKKNVNERYKVNSEVENNLRKIFDEEKYQGIAKKIKKIYRIENSTQARESEPSDGAMPDTANERRADSPSALGSYPTQPNASEYPVYVPGQGRDVWKPEIDAYVRIPNK